MSVEEFEEQPRTFSQESGLSEGYVQISGDIPSEEEEEEEDIYGAGPEEEKETAAVEGGASSAEKKKMESTEGSRAGVEDVSSSESSREGTAKQLKSVEATGYLSFLNALDPVALYIIYWRDVKLSAVVLGVCLAVLLTLLLNTFLHTLVLLLLSFMVVSLTYIVAKLAMDYYRNKDVDNPFRSYLSKKIELPEDLVIECVRQCIKELNCTINMLVRLLLFENVKKSLIFGVILWTLSHFTNYLSVMNTLFAVVVLAFSVPVLYEKFQTNIDDAVGKAIVKGKDLFCKLKKRMPFLGKSKEE